MSYRAQWKMIHTLNTCTKGQLSTNELIDMGVDCYNDTIQELASQGIVMADPATGNLKLHPIASALINKFIVCRNEFGGSIMYIDQPSCFTIMPFSRPWSDKVYNEFISPTVVASNIFCIRGDTIPRGKHLASNLYNTFNKAGFMIVDRSDQNANVLYELGVADTLGKDCFILIQQDQQDKIPADIKGVHYYNYDLNDFAPAMAQLSTGLNQWIFEHRIENTLKYVASKM
jgi:hypothetical protein